jgi:hypothetical protein
MSHIEPASSSNGFEDIAEISQLSHITDASRETIDNLFMHTFLEIINRAENADFHTTSLSSLLSRDIELATAIDTIPVCEVTSQASLSFFLEEVNCPLITPYDEVNWHYMKMEIAELGLAHPAIDSAISAVSALYRAQLYGLPLSKALSLYKDAYEEYVKLIDDYTQPFALTLAVTFLLCLFAVVHYETTPILKEPSEAFTRRLSIWSQQVEQFSPFCLKIVTWLKLLHISTLRGGGTGLILDSVISLLPDYSIGLANSRLSSSRKSDASTHIHEMLIGPIFEFYYQLQIISGQLARLTHYHRSRSTSTDQEEVSNQINYIELQLRELWERRSATQRQTPDQLRSCLTPHISNSIISLIGICASAYHAEFIEMDRVLGNPASKSTLSKQAMRQIRDIIDGDWNAYMDGKLNTGYLRPLFLIAIESRDRDECQWAVERLRQIKNPICRSDFFASYGLALSNIQLQEGRRVTSKYFCMRYFGISPPFL